MNMCKGSGKIIPALGILTTILFVVLGPVKIGAAELGSGGSPRIYIQPQEGFESYIAAAIVKKHVPAVVTENKGEAEYLLTSAVIAKEESAGSKVARCLFMYCAGAEGSQTATVQLVNIRTQNVAWAYNVRKGSAKAYQSSAEAIAKHLKQFLEEHPQ